MNRPAYNRFNPSKSTGHRPASAVVAEHELSGSGHSESDLVLTHLIQELQRQQRKLDSEALRITESIQTSENRWREECQQQLTLALAKLSTDLTEKFQTRLETELKSTLEEQTLLARRDLKAVHLILEEHQTTAGSLWDDMSATVLRVEEMLRKRQISVDNRLDRLEEEFRLGSVESQDSFERKLVEIDSRFRSSLAQQSERMDRLFSSKMDPLVERVERLDSEIVAVNSLSSQNRKSIESDFNGKLMELRRLLEEFQSSAKAADAASSDRMDKLYKQQQSDIDQILCRLDALTINAENRKSTADALWEQRLQRLEESLLASDGQNRVIDKDFSNGSDFERLEKRLDKLNKRHEVAQERSKLVEQQLKDLIGQRTEQAAELEELRQENDGLRLIIAQMRQEMEEATTVRATAAANRRHTNDNDGSGGGGGDKQKEEEEEENVPLKQLQVEIDQLKTQLAKLTTKSSRPAQQPLQSDSRLLEMSNTLQAQLRALKEAQLQLCESRREIATQTKLSKPPKHGGAENGSGVESENKNHRLVDGMIIGVKQPEQVATIEGKAVSSLRQRSKSPSKLAVRRRIMDSAPSTRIVRNFNDLLAAEQRTR